MYLGPHDIFENELRLSSHYETYELDDALEYKNKEQIKWIESIAGYGTQDYLHEIWLSFPNLEYLGLGDSCRRIPKTIFTLKKLKILDLSSNYISEIPREIENLTELVLLNLEGNDISILPLEVYTLPHLRFLLVGGNPIQIDPSKIIQMPYLESLTIDGSSLTQAEQALIRAHKPHIWMG